MTRSQSITIMAFVDDLLFGSKIEAVARHLGYELLFVPTAVSIAPDTAQTDEMSRPGEPIHGRAGQLTTYIVAQQPALLIFDLDNAQIPWQKWLAPLKTSPATRRIPALCYAAHVHKDLLDKATLHGADKVVSRGALSANLPDLLQEMVRVPDYEALTAACGLPLSARAIEGLELFNQGEYYECHHALEDAWNADASAGRNLYKGILQVAVGYMQIERGNYNGGVKLLLRMRQWLDPLPAVCRGIEVGRLRDEATAVLEALQALGPERIAEFDRTLFKPIVWS